MAVKIIMTVCLYPVVFLMYFLLKNEGQPKKGMAFGAMLTGSRLQEPEVVEVVKAYNRQMNLLFAALVFLPLPVFFIPWESIVISFWMLWILAAIFAFVIPFAIANGKIKAVKREKGWKKGEDALKAVEIKHAGKVRLVRFYQFAAPCLLSAGAFIWALAGFRGERQEALGIAVGSMAFVTFLIYFMAVWMDSQKTKVISTESEANLGYARAGKNLWKNLWMWLAWINAVYALCMLFMLDANWQLSDFFFWTTALYILATIILLLLAVKKRRSIDAAYKDKMDVEPVDDDDKWIWGILYYNPKDKHSMVEKRVGIGTTMNMATPAGKGLAVFSGLALLSLPVLCVWLILLEFTPIQLSVEKNLLVASQIREEYRIPVTLIENVTLLEELPKLSRVSGTGMEELRKGTFRIPEEGKCQVFMNPANSLFIRFEASGVTYYMSGYDDEETMAVYEELLRLSK